MMKKLKTKLTVILGVVVMMLLAASSWYSITFNDWRLVAPMDHYTFQPRDLPMLISISMVILYVLYLGVLFMRAAIAEKQRRATSKTTRKIDPRLGLLGFFGLFGFLGFWTYSVDKSIFPFAFFMFFGFFGFFYEGKMSNTFMDERYQENLVRAQLTAHRVTLAIIFLVPILISRGALLGSLEYTLIAVIILISLALALDVFLGEYLLYRYDHDGQTEDGGE